MDNKEIIKNGTRIIFNRTIPCLYLGYPYARCGDTGIVIGRSGLLPGNWIVVSGKHNNNIHDLQFCVDRSVFDIISNINEKPEWLISLLK